MNIGLKKVTDQIKNENWQKSGRKIQKKAGT